MKKRTRRRVAAAAARSTHATAHRQIVSDIERRVAETRAQVWLAINEAVVLLHWDIGRHIREHEALDFTTEQAAERLAADLRAAFPHMRQLTARQFAPMRALAQHDFAQVQAVFAYVPWPSLVLLFETVTARDAQLWYAREYLANAWSEEALGLEIESDAYARRGHFRRTSVAPQPPRSSGAKP
jgi:hypothetical protein